MEKINNSIFNSLFENSVRILILLHELGPTAISSESLCALDYIVIYGKTFNFTNVNLHGQNPYGFSEYISRRKIMPNIIKQLVLYKLVDVEFCPIGYKFKINDIGIAYIESLDSNYAYLYQESARIVIDQLTNKSENELIDLISKQKGAHNV